MNSDESAFIAAIIAKPDDDLPRLIYADYLDERGEAERAEFIRVQCEIDTLRKKPGWLPTDYEMVKAGSADQLQMLFRLNNHDRESRLDDLRRRERELLCANAWTARELPWPPGPWDRRIFGETPHPDNPHPKAFFRRGFVESITCSWADWRTHADAIRVSCPLRRVKLTSDVSVEFRGANEARNDPRDDQGFIRVGRIEGLTGWHRFGNGAGELRQRLLSEAYPGIAFELPVIAAGQFVYVDQYGEMRPAVPGDMPIGIATSPTSFVAHLP